MERSMVSVLVVANAGGWSLLPCGVDGLMYKYPPHPLTITLTEDMTNPLPDSNAIQDTTLPDAPTTTALAEKDGWKMVEGKAMQKMRI
jgi:hypothetical protein